MFHFRSVNQVAALIGAMSLVAAGTAFVLNGSNDQTAWLEPSLGLGDSGIGSLLLVTGALLLVSSLKGGTPNSHKRMGPAARGSRGSQPNPSGLSEFSNLESLIRWDEKAKKTTADVSQQVSSRYPHGRALLEQDSDED